MANGSVTAPSFEFYEGIRILVPGGLAVALYSGVVATFDLDAPSAGGDALGALGAALFVGLLLLFMDAPAKSAAYRYRLPNEELDQWKVAPPEGTTTVNVYFVLLDEALPKGVADRALYTGSIFRIGYETIYLSFITAIAVLSFGLFTVGSGPQRESADAVEVALLVGAALHACLPLFAMAAGYLQQGRRGSPRAWKAVLKGMRDGIPLADRILLLSAAAAATWYLNGGSTFAGVGSIALPSLLWSFRYHRGHRPRDRAIPTHALCRRSRAYFRGERKPPRNPRPPEAVFTLGWAGATACLLASFDLPARSALDMTATVGWLSASLFAGVLVIARGHERKLLASYRTQSTWLKLHREELIDRYFVTSTEGMNEPGEGPPPREPTQTERRTVRTRLRELFGTSVRDCRRQGRRPSPGPKGRPT